MHKLFIDFETYYTQDYSLRKMTTVEYLQSPLYETVGAAVALDNGPSKWLWGDELHRLFERLDPAETATVSHNAKFDGAILAWKFGFVPVLYMDTLGMARALLAHKLARLDLHTVAQHLLNKSKGTALANFKGFRRDEIKRHPTRMDYIDYALNDNDLCRGIFTALSKDFPRNEFLTLDNIVRMFTCPQLTLDQGVLTPHLANVKRAKQELLDRIAHQNAEILQSNERFAAELMSLGIDPPRKISAKTGKEAWAFAKNDPGLKELAEHPDPRVQNLVAARLGHKSTIEETRTERFIRIARLYPTWPDREAYIPIPLHYSGAHTHRLSGADGLNMQNLPRVNPKDPTSGALRRSIRAAKGYVIVSIDLSQIEARMVCWLAGAIEFLMLFATGKDPYAHMGKKVGAMPMDAVKDTPEYAFGRQLGKGIILGCGFGMSGPKFQITVANAPYFLTLSLQEAMEAVAGYRREVPEVPEVWKQIGNAFKYLAYREGPQGRYRQALRYEIQRGFVYEAHGDTVRVELPSGLHLKYEGLRAEPGGQYGEELWFNYAGRRNYIYGGKGTENLVQALARCVIEGAAIEIRKQTGIVRAHQVHDENIFAVPERHAEDFVTTAKAITVKSPAWCPDLPLGCDAKIGHNYAEAH